MADKIFRWSFYALFILTPLIFTPYNNELFEFNKMLLTYALTTIIVGCWFYKMVNQRRLIFKRTVMDIPLVLFLISQILSTIFSIDPHTSIFGYYSRLNGGLLSTASYLLLYWAFVSNVTREEAVRFLKASLIGGAIVALWAIPEHFGYSPSCAILVGRWADDCWVQDVQARVFASLGQPNWLAAYMEMLLFPAIYFFVVEKTPLKKTLYYLATIAFYLAFTFTFSRGAMLGVIGGAGILVVFLVKEWFSNRKLAFSWLQPMGVALVTLVVINLLFGSALTGDFHLIKQDAAPARPSIAGSAGGTQLENGGTESGQIRLIVWQGALDIFKHYPLLGSGVETFAYSYYLYRPVAHNMVSEWDFLYNKAHNEYLNYLSTTGIVGFTTYMLAILVFIGWSILRVFNLKFEIYNLNSNLKLKISNSKLESNLALLVATMLASFVAYLIQNFFWFFGSDDCDFVLPFAGFHCCYDRR